MLFMFYTPPVELLSRNFGSRLDTLYVFLQKGQNFINMISQYAQFCPVSYQESRNPLR